MKNFCLMIAFLFIALLATACGSNSGGEHTHSYSKNVFAATCTENGSVTFTCSCGDSYTEEVGATGHSYSVTDNKTATCTENGYAKYVCVCGDSYTEEIMTTGHSYSAADSKAATCKENGYVKYACFCGDSYTEETRASHIWQAATCSKPSTCQTCGDTTGAARGHNWEAATCTTPKTCKTCGDTTGTAKGHKWKEATCTTPKTCTNCKMTTGDATGHNWKNATCTKAKTCSRCQKTEGSALGHTYTTKTTPATCTKQGFTTYTCSCGDSYVSDYTNRISHAYYKYVCAKCGTVDKSHAYEYLIEWVKANGTQEGDSIEYIFEGKNNPADCYGLTYLVNNDYLYIWRYYASNGYSSYTAIALDIYYYGFSFANDWIYGDISPSTYTRNTSLTYNSSDCHVLTPEKLLPTAKSSVDLLIVTFRSFLNENNFNITIADLGFKSF